MARRTDEHSELSRRERQIMDIVYRLGEDNEVSLQRITTGARVGNGWAVTEGLTGNEQVVVQGIQRLRDGMAVQPSEGQPVGGG